MSDWTMPGGNTPDDNGNTPDDDGPPPTPPTALSREGQGASPPPPPPPPTPGSAGSGGAPRDEVAHVATFPLRPMSLSELLDAVFKLLRKVALPAAIVCVVVLGPIQILVALGTVNAPSFTEAMNQDLSAPIRPFDGYNLPLIGLGLLLSTLATAFVTPALVWLGLQSDRDPLPTAGKVLAAGWRWFGRTLGVSLVVAAGIVVPLAVLAGIVAALTAAASPVFAILFLPLALVALVAGIAYLVVVSLGGIVVVVEDLGVMATVRRAYALWRARFWPVIGYLIVGSIVVQLLAGAVSAPFTIPPQLLDFPGELVLLAIGGVVSVLIATPITTFYAMAVYFDTRVRTEGYDVTVQAGTLA